MVLVVLSYWTYAGITAFLTPNFDSISLITGTLSVNLSHVKLLMEILDRYSGIPRLEEKEKGYRFYWRFADEAVTPEAVDLPLDLVNRVLYPPRKRPVPPRDVPLTQ